MSDKIQTWQGVYSARYILEEFSECSPEGIAHLSKCLGYPEGVIYDALQNIFKCEDPPIEGVEDKGCRPTRKGK